MVRIGLFFFFLLSSSFAFSDLAKIHLDSELGDFSKSERIWKGSLGLNFNWVGNTNYVGLSNSNSITPGVTASLSYKLIEQNHEWRNYANFALQYNYYPPPFIFVKQNDVLTYETIYLFHWKEWGGLFAGLNAKTSVAPGEDIESGATTYKIIDSITQEQIGGIITADKLKLTDPFMPFALEQHAGVFYQPLRKKELFLEFRLGGFGRELFAGGQRVIIQNNNEPYTVRQLTNVYELGPGFGSLFHMSLYKKKLVYRLTLDMAVALLQSPVILPNTFGDRFNFDLNSKLSYSFLSWLSLDWNLKVLRNPVLIDKFQVLSNLTLAANFSF